jgi:hypothetical protein
MDFKSRYKLSKERTRQRKKARKSIKRQFIQRLSKKKKSQQRFLRQEARARELVETWKRLRASRQRQLPLRVAAFKQPRALVNLGARSSTCRLFSTNVALARSKFLAAGIGRVYDSSIAIAIEEQNPAITPEQLEARANSYFYTQDESNGLMVLATRYFKDSENYYGEARTTVHTYNEVEKYIALSLQKQQQAIDLQHETFDLPVYVRIVVTNIDTAQYHAIGCIATASTVYVLQTRNNDPDRFAIKTVVSELFSKDVVFAPDDVFPDVAINIQKEDALFGEGECELWSLILPYALAEAGAFKSDNPLEVMANLKYLYDYANATWTMPGAYNEYLRELNLL